MNLFEAVGSVYRNFGNFNGRASRSEFWWFQMFLLIIYFFVFVLSIRLPIVGPMLAGLVLLANLLPSLAVLARRLHDSDKSGWWVLIAFVPLGNLLLLIFALLPSDPGPNRYGSGPSVRSVQPGFPGAHAPRAAGVVPAVRTRASIGRRVLQQLRGTGVTPNSNAGPGELATNYRVNNETGQRDRPEAVSAMAASTTTDYRRIMC